MGPHAGGATGAFGGAPIWGHEALYWWGGRSGPNGTFAGAFYGAAMRLYWATKRVTGVPNWGGAALRTAPLEPEVKLSMGPRSV